MPTERGRSRTRTTRGRQLIPTGGFGALTARAVSHPEEIAAIRALSSSDQEHLVMGCIEPYEIRVHDVHTPPPQPRWSWWVPTEIERYSKRGRRMSDVHWQT